MRQLLVVLLHAHVLLRGAAVPHVHPGPGDASHHAERAHVHLAGHAHHHHDRPSDEPSPDHDRHAVYLDDDRLFHVAAGPVSPGHAGTGWLIAPAWVAQAVAPTHLPQPRRVRPPGHGAPAFHSLLPHVLRV